jgi:hypothetical protein
VNSLRFRRSAGEVNGDQRRQVEQQDAQLVQRHSAEVEGVKPPGRQKVAKKFSAVTEDALSGAR